ncbi:MAG TPA: D-tyrosyl-tRNA(Tyr) deacylase [Actinobacteria bacterium]|nr:D-tyrosyl-tRNA(Tyr) deacylase [Actinomycetota bacterium]
MRAVLQRVSSAQVEVGGAVVGSIQRGLLALVGVAAGDDGAAADRLAEAIVHLRIFPDDAGKMNLSVADIGGSVLVVSQFTLLADTSRGRRPSFSAAAPPATAEELVGRVAVAIGAAGVGVATGRFGAHMVVSLVNDGPVTIVLEEGRSPPG